MMTLTRNQLTLLAGGGSAGLLALALIFQAFGFSPCDLCILQRWPHLAAVLIAVAAVFLRSRVLCWAGAAAALTTGAIAIYHSGVERHWWTGPDTCTSGAVGNLSSEQLMDQIMNAPLVRCDEIAITIFGLSMANWNVIASAVLAAIWVMAARKG